MSQRENHRGSVLSVELSKLLKHFRYQVGGVLCRLTSGHKPPVEILSARTSASSSSSQSRNNKHQVLHQPVGFAAWHRPCNSPTRPLITIRAVSTLMLHNSPNEMSSECHRRQDAPQAWQQLGRQLTRYDEAPKVSPFVEVVGEEKIIKRSWMIGSMRDVRWDLSHKYLSLTHKPIRLPLFAAVSTE